MRESAEARVPSRLALRVLLVEAVLQAFLLVALVLMFPAAAGAAPLIKGDVCVATNGGYVRLVFSFTEDNEAEARLGAPPPRPTSASPGETRTGPRCAWRSCAR
jgi:hypothetical protein